MDPRPVNVLSLAAGAGGLDLGVKLAVPAARLVCAVEIEAYACHILASRMEEGRLDDAPIWTDLRTFDGKPWRGVVDLLTAGYPCQPFSHAGRRKGADDPRHLWPHVMRILCECQPALVFIENVRGHVTLGFREVRDDLHRLGYEVEAGLFAAVEAGAPHRRARLFALAHHHEAGLHRLGSGWVRFHERARAEASAGRDADGRGGEGVRGRGAAGSASALGAARREGEGDQRQRGRNAGRNPSAAVGDDHIQGLEGRQLRGGGRDGERAPRATGGAVEHSAGLSEREPRDAALSLARDDARTDAGRRHGCVAPFPPLPEDREGWARYLQRWPGLEPALRRDADGMADRMDRLRLTGNGVVPHQAARAFRTLAGRIP